jgi:hypothetical protein
MDRACDRAIHCSIDCTVYIMEFQIKDGDSKLLEIVLAPYPLPPSNTIKSLYRSII